MYDTTTISGKRKLYKGNETINPMWFTYEHIYLAKIM